MKDVHTNNAPAAIGPYTQAKIVGNMVYTSGQIAIVPATGNLAEGGIEAQSKQVCENLKAVLTEEAVTAHELVARHDVRNGYADAVQHRFYLLRAVAHAVEHYFLIRLPKVIPQAGVYLIKEKCHFMPLCGHIILTRSASFTHWTNASETLELSR